SRRSSTSRGPGGMSRPDRPSGLTAVTAVSRPTNSDVGERQARPPRSCSSAGTRYQGRCSPAVRRNAMRTLRVIAAGFGAGAAILLGSTPALAADGPDATPQPPLPAKEQPGTPAPKPPSPAKERPTTPALKPPNPAKPSAQERPEATRPAAPRPDISEKPGQVEVVPKGGAETGGGPVSEDDSALLIGG